MAVVFLSHLPYLGLPLFWDELGQFVPAALDLYREGRWIPRSALPNVHPPALMAYLAMVWKLCGYSIVTTRVAMLLLAGLTGWLSWRVAQRLCPQAFCATVAATLLACSPLFYTQAMLAQLDLPAALLTLWALEEFLRDRVARAALVCTLLVLTKETGLVAPAVFAVWLWRERRDPRAAWFGLPVAALGAWLWYLKAHSGYWAGNPEFAHYNLWFPLHPVRLLGAVARRAVYLLLDQFHWLGWVAVWRAWRRTALYRTRAWAVAAAFAVAHTVAVTVLGGAGLERYLLPVLPLMYTAMAAGWSLYRPVPRRLNQAAALAGLIVCWFWTRPLPSPLENNLAMVDFISLHRCAAQDLEVRAAGRTILTAWPLSEALRSADFGYVRRGLKVREIPDFAPRRIEALARQGFDVLVVYRKDWNPGPWLEWFPTLRRWREQYWAFPGEVSPAEARRTLGLEPVAGWERKGLWLAIFDGSRRRRPTR